MPEVIPQPTYIDEVPAHRQFMSLGEVGQHVRASPKDLGIALCDLKIKKDHSYGNVVYINKADFGRLVDYFNRIRSSD